MEEDKYHDNIVRMIEYELTDKFVLILMELCQKELY